MNKTPMKFLLDMEPKEIKRYVEDSGFGEYRLKQLLKWIYRKRVAAFSECSDLPSNFRENLEKNFLLRSMSIKEKRLSRLDGTVRYFFLTPDGLTVPTVFLPQKNRNSVCVSTQAGCPVGCLFCASGRASFRRNLTRGEILEQIMQVEKDSGSSIDSILFMGMGEPLFNRENVQGALRALADQDLFGYGRRKVILSTIGIVPEIEKLAQQKVGVRLAISLHAPDDETRGKLIPRRAPYGVSEILEAGLEYARRSKSRLTIEYILIAGINDSLECASKLWKLLDGSMVRGDRIQINLIPYNPTGTKGFSAPSQESVQAFKDYLAKKDLLTIIRVPRGLDIGAACGQLLP